MMKKALAALLFALPLFAQKAVETNIQQISDRRTSGSFKQLHIVLELPKIKSSEVAASRVLVSEAVDDAGQSLVDTERGQPELETNHMATMMSGEESTRPVTVSMTLASPARTSTKLKAVRGEIELFMPSKDANSIADIPKFMSLTGKALSHKALKANGVEITLLSAAQIEAEKKKLAEAKRKESAQSGWEGPDLEGLVKSFFESLFQVQESELLARVKDPNKRIQEIAYIDAAGETKRVMMRDDEGLTVLSSWSEKPAPDWKLRVSMKTPKNLVRHSFALSDVALP